MSPSRVCFVGSQNRRPTVKRLGKLSFMLCVLCWTSVPRYSQICPMACEKPCCPSCWEQWKSLRRMRGEALDCPGCGYVLAKYEDISTLWLQQHARKCPGCGIWSQRDNPHCEQVECVRCGHRWMWLSSSREANLFLCTLLASIMLLWAVASMFSSKILITEGLGTICFVTCGLAKLWWPFLWLWSRPSWNVPPGGIQIRRNGN